jgi:hypothetical protein
VDHRPTQFIKFFYFISMIEYNEKLRKKNKHQVAQAEVRLSQSGHGLLLLQKKKSKTQVD